MRQPKKRSYNKLILALVLLLVLVAVVAVLELTNITHLFHKEKVPPVIPTHSNSSDTQSSKPSTSNNGSSDNTQTQTPTTSPPENHTLIAPTGNFVSNHFPGQNNSPTTESSTCNTTPGVACYIMFTNIDTGQTTQLPSQITDSRGSTSWYWDVRQDAHLTTGRWKVTAVAELNNQTKTTMDALNLTIQ